jgi:hypothetical protein
MIFAFQRRELRTRQRMIVLVFEVQCSSKMRENQKKDLLDEAIQMGMMFPWSETVYVRFNVHVASIF